MRIEITSASQFLVDLVRLSNASSSSLSEEQLERFKSNVSDILQRHYTNHWFPDKPFKGSGYRCIRINGKMDPLIARAGFMMGLAVSFLRSLFPSELTMWVDPREVSYRIGENGSICILYEGLEKTITSAFKKGEEAAAAAAALPPPAPAPTEPAAASKTTPEKTVSVVVQQQQQAPSPPPALPQHHQPPPQQQQQQVHHHHHQQQHHHHHQQQHHHHHHHQQQQHHFSPSKSVVVSSSPLQQLSSRPMSPITSQLSQQQNQQQQQQQQQQQAAAAAMQLSMFLMNKDSGLIKCKESLQRGLEVARPLQMDRLFVSS